MKSVLLTCRAGFESDLAAEIQRKSAEVGVAGFVRAQQNDGYVIFEGYEDDAGKRLVRQLAFSTLIFARQWLVVIEHAKDISSEDRVKPIALVYQSVQTFRELWLSFPDTNEGKGLSKLTRMLQNPLTQALKPRIDGEADWIAHVFFLKGTDVFIGLTPVKNSSQWICGFPRLRQPSSAPSRSTLKLEEAWLQLIPDHKRAEWIKPFQRAVDLGAAPGGWTWQLVNRGLQVTAVDNGPMNQDLMDSGQVIHLREDAFSFKPVRDVDWLVCDMVEKPSRVAELMERWLTKGWTRFAIFNLKLPMKKRWQEVEQILAHMEDAFQQSGKTLRISAKQLYHDREEITVMVAPQGVY